MSTALIATWEMALKDQKKLVASLRDKTREVFEQFKVQTAPGLDEVKKEFGELVHALRVENKFLHALKKKMERLESEIQQS